MRLLDRYLLRELLFPLAYCLCGLLLLVIAGDLFYQMGTFQKKQLGAGDIVQYYLVMAPGYLAFLLPISLLLALLYALTNHARHQEITAMRAAGVSLWRLCLPYLAVGLLASATLFVLNEVYVPDSDEAADRILARHEPRAPGALPRNQLANLPFTNARNHRQWHIGVYDTDTGAMFNPLVLWTQPDGSCLWIKAKRAARIGGVWTFREVEESRQGSEPGALAVPLLKTNVLAFPQFSETREQINSTIEIGTVIIAHKAKKADIPLRKLFDYLRLNPEPIREDAQWLYTKLYGRLAAPWTCLVVVLIAVPFAAGSGRQNAFVGVASSLVLFFSFWVLQLAGLAAGAGGWVPPWLAAWMPNLVFGSAGLLMMTRIR